MDLARSSALVDENGNLLPLHLHSDASGLHHLRKAIDSEHDDEFNDDFSEADTVVRRLSSDEVRSLMEKAEANEATMAE